MKKLLFTMLLAAMAVADAYAQPKTVALVTADGVSAVYATLSEAVKKATDNSYIYLPGGFTTGGVTINKKVTIVGASSQPEDTDNVDGIATISGSITFDVGSEGSCLMGVHVTGDVSFRAGSDCSMLMGAYVKGSINLSSANNILIKYCNAECVSVDYSSNFCEGIIINQSFLRGTSKFNNNAAVAISNSVVGCIYNLSHSTIDHNVICESNGRNLYYVSKSIITNNLFIPSSYSFYSCSDNFVSNNLYGVTAKYTMGENSLVVSDSKLVVDYSHGISPESDFHLADSIGVGAATDGTDIGIYGGSGFDFNFVTPIPRIVSKDIPEETDADGKLKVKIEARFD